ncbi:MAG TPA: cytochrome c3 family protein [Bryobacteraceae bacterium]
MRAFILAVVVLTAAGAEADDKACLGCHAVIQTILSKSNAHPAMALGCQPCHTDHTQSAAAGPAHHLKSPPQELCVTCHPEKTKKEFVHEPAKRECTICHSPHEGLKDGLRAQSNALCLECHSDASKSKFETSGPVKLFDGHVTLPAQYFGSLPLLALQNDRGHPVSNHPVLREQDTEWPAVSCTVCHDPHGADKSAALLVTETLDFVDLCQRCHK